jgi:phage shock protein E
MLAAAPDTISTAEDVRKQRPDRLRAGLRFGTSVHNAYPTLKGANNMPSARRVRTAAIASVLGAPLFLSLGCAGSLPGQTDVLQVTPAQAQALIQDRLNDADFVVLDVRNPEEFAAGHIGGAVNVCFLCSTFGDDLAVLDKTKTYLVYCASGNRSGRATAQMNQHGFDHLYDLTGGVNRWKADGLPVVQ